jgi:ankyrin repeat protein
VTAVALHSNPELIRLLLGAGADPKLKDNEGKTSLQDAGKNPSLKDNPEHQMLAEAVSE